MSTARDHVQKAWCELLLALLADARFQQLTDPELAAAQQSLGLLSGGFGLDPEHAAKLISKLAKKPGKRKP